MSTEMIHFSEVKGQGSTSKAGQWSYTAHYRSLLIPGARAEGGQLQKLQHVDFLLLRCGDCLA